MYYEMNTHAHARTKYMEYIVLIIRIRRILFRVNDSKILFSDWLQCVVRCTSDPMWIQQLIRRISFFYVPLSGTCEYESMRATIRVDLN